MGKGSVPHIDPSSNSADSFPPVGLTLRSQFAVYAPLPIFNGSVVYFKVMSCGIPISPEKYRL